MSALGDYIHFNVDDYINYGTYKRNSSGKKNSYKSLQNHMRKRVESLKSRRISPETIKTLKYRLRADSDAQIQREQNNEQIKWNKILEEVLDELVQLSTEAAFEQYNSPINKFDLGIHQGQLTEQEYERYKNIIDSISNILKDIKINGNMATEQQFDAILDLYNQLNFKKFGELQSISSVGQIQEIVDQTVYSKIETAISGVFGEKFVYAIRDSAWNNAIRGLNNNIPKERIAGGDTSNITISANLINPRYGEIPRGWHYNMDNNTYKVASTQDKIDVAIIVNKENVYASVKNSKQVTSTKRPKLQEIKPYYTLLYLNQFYNFGNHFLNMIAAREQKSEIQNNKEDAIDIFKQEVNYEALVQGNPFKQIQTPNIFIDFDRATGKVIIFNIYDFLLDRQHQDLFKYEVKSLDQVLNALLQSNEWALTSEARISRIITTLRNLSMRVFLQTYRLD